MGMRGLNQYIHDPVQQIQPEYSFFAVYFNWHFQRFRTSTFNGDGDQAGGRGAQKLAAES